MLSLNKKKKLKKIYQAKFFIIPVSDEALMFAPNLTRHLTTGNFPATEAHHKGVAK